LCRKDSTPDSRAQQRLRSPRLATSHFLQQLACRPSPGPPRGGTHASPRRQGTRDRVAVGVGVGLKIPPPYGEIPAVSKVRRGHNKGGLRHNNPTIHRVGCRPLAALVGREVGALERPTSGQGSQRGRLVSAGTLSAQAPRGWLSTRAVDLDTQHRSRANCQRRLDNDQRVRSRRRCPLLPRSGPSSAPATGSPADRPIPADHPIPVGFPGLPAHRPHNGPPGQALTAASASAETPTPPTTTAPTPHPANPIPPRCPLPIAPGPPPGRPGLPAGPDRP
jgi:hypothetical protein